MNRLQKKCFFATAGFHLLLVVILVVGPAFFRPQPKTDDSQVVDVIPSNVIDAQFNQGVRDAQPPPPTPVVTPPPPQPQPVQPPPVPVEPTPSFVEKVEKMLKPEPDKPVKPDLTPAVKPKTEPHKIQVNKQLVTRDASQNASKPDNSAAKARALQKALRNLQHNFSESTKVDMPGTGAAAYASYDSAVKSIYYQAWMQILLDKVAKDGEDVIVEVHVANDGTVVSARIVTSSGDPKVDESVRRTLERVKYIAPFPEGVTEKERPYSIDFNTTVANQMLQ